MTCSSCGSPLPEGAPACVACGAPRDGKAVVSLPATSISGRNLRPVSFREEKAVVAVRTADVLLGRYRLEDKIGEGGMGTVFIAHDSELDRKVAVKLLSAALVNETEVRERFEREARLTAKLDHPNIIPIYDVGTHEGRPFIVMKLLQGDSLVGRLRAKGGFTAEETLKLMRQLALGLDYLHGQGFIHRDIKAANIFVSPEGHATILDFGILRQKSASTGITRTGMVMGTPHYMAPEQALGLKDVDHRVDLYALAVVLFECLTGTLPFEADSELRLIQLQAHAPVPEILDRAPWIPKPVAAVVKKSLSKKPDERFQTAAELVTALEAAYLEHKSSKSGLPVVPGPAPVLPATTAPSLRKLNSKVSSAALPVVAGAPDPSTGELSAAVRGSRAPWVIAGLVLLVGAGVGGWFLFKPDEVRLDPPVAVVDAGLQAPLAAVEDAGAATEDAGTAMLAEAPDAGAGEPEPVDAGALAAVEPNPVNNKRPHFKKKGRVNVITTHAGEPYWAQVSIDGVPRGRTPLLLDLPVGKYQVLIERPGFRSQSREIRVAGGRSVVVKLELVP